MLFRTVFEDYLLKWFVLLAVWCSSWSSVIRYNTEEKEDTNQIRIRHHKNRNENMTRHHHNSSAGHHNRDDVGYKHTGEYDDKDHEHNAVKPTVGDLDTWTESYPDYGYYGYWPEPGTTFPW